MSSDLASIVRTIEFFDCSPVIIISLVGYDYFLTFSREIDAVWCRPWTKVSTIFVIVRYIGLCWSVILALIGSTFIPGPVDYKDKAGFFFELKGSALLVIGDWGYVVFLAAADFVMILRVSAMWNRSRIIFWSLLSIYVAQMIVSILWEVIYTNPGTKTVIVTIDQVFRFKSCTYSTPTAPSATYRGIPRFVLGGALMILAIVSATRQSFEMYRMTKRWQTNPTMSLLVREGAVYFIVNLLFNIVNSIQLSNAAFLLFIDSLGYALSCAVVPRFIISIRELYDRDIQERWQGIDTGFGRRSEMVFSEGTSIAFEDTILGPGRTDEPEVVELVDVGPRDDV